MRSIGVVTGSRADYSIYLPLLRAIVSEPSLELVLLVTGTHLSPEFGYTVTMIEEDGFRVSERVEMTLSSDSPEGIAKAMGLATIGFAQVFSRRRPDLLVVLGDRFEMHAATVATLPFKIPVAHIHGGELTEGAFDDALRHSITKLSHLHFVSTETYANRLLQMGEDAWRITVSGALSLDNLQGLKLLSCYELEVRIGLRLDQSPLLITFHPTTLEYEQTEWQVQELLEALRHSNQPMVFTLPNADTHGRTIRKHLEAFVQDCPCSVLVDNLGTQGYFSLMALAAAMVGNSSSGIIEAASFRLPVINVGTRQQGRVRAANVIDVGHGRDEIRRGIEEALRPQFRASLQGLANPYGEGRAADVTIETIKKVALDDALVTKRFADLPASSASGESRQAS